VSNALGLLFFVVYVLAIVGAAAGITWVVVRLTPSRKPDGPAKPS
jgi:H+/Cl- antiporter ClcA